ncbi:MAG: hypothetical protein ACFCUX_01300 [Candidatus Methylacidiphilales bacterium]
MVIQETQYLPCVPGDPFAERFYLVEQLVAMLTHVHLEMGIPTERAYAAAMSLLENDYPEEISLLSDAPGYQRSIENELIAQAA